MLTYETRVHNLGSIFIRINRFNGGEIEYKLKMYCTGTDQTLSTLISMGNDLGQKVDIDTSINVVISLICNVDGFFGIPKSIRAKLKEMIV